MTWSPPGAADGTAVGRPVAGRDQGAAVVDFVLVGSLLTLMFAALLQLTMVLHVRNTLIDCATEAARYGALADRDPAAGQARAVELIDAELPAQYAGDVTTGIETIDGLTTVVVRVRAPLPLLGLLGGPRDLTVAGHAVREGA